MFENSPNHDETPAHSILKCPSSLSNRTNSAPVARTTEPLLKVVATLADASSMHVATCKENDQPHGPTPVHQDSPAGRTEEHHMFGKTKEPTDIDERPDADIVIDDFFGDEAAVAEAVRVDRIQERIIQVEQQINSQFTSMAAYAQIAQDQIELVRSESQHAVERTERRMVGLIETERADRRSESTGGTLDVTARLDSLDAQVVDIRESLQQCLSNQKALADAIIDLFQPGSSADLLADAVAETEGLAAPTDTPIAAVPAGVPATMPAPLTSAPRLDASIPSDPTAPVVPFVGPIAPSSFELAGPVGGPIGELSLD